MVWAMDQPDMADPPAFFVGDQTGALEDAHVFANRRQGNIMRPGQLAEGRLAPGQLRQHRAAGGIPERGENRVQRTG